ncbi:hypothetical protein [Streptomyces sp. NPDC050738]|uniref:hypothetical protein n=1 Tax=Streptomyces sp. NPDC050738 TaxID=3154744 RepID=UPI00343093B0
MASWPFGCRRERNQPTSAKAVQAQLPHQRATSREAAKTGKGDAAVNFLFARMVREGNTLYGERSEHGEWPRQVRALFK